MKPTIALAALILMLAAVAVANSTEVVRVRKAPVIVKQQPQVL